MGSRRPFSDRFAQCSRQRGFCTARSFTRQKGVQARVRVNGRCVLCHQTSRIGGGPVVAMNVTADHAQHGHQLAAVVRCMSEPPHHHPRARPPDVEEVRLFFPPMIALLAKNSETFSTVLRVALDELEAEFQVGERWGIDIDPEHAAEPEILAHALVHHLLMHTTAPSIVGARADGQIIVRELAPDADHLDSF